MPDAALLAEATRWRVLLPVGALEGITEADAYRLGREHNVRPDRAWVRLYADGPEEQGPWSPAPSVSVTEDTTARYARTAADLLRQRNEAASELERVTAERDQLFTTLADVLGNFHEKGHPGAPCIRTGWVREETYARWHGVLAGIVADSAERRPGRG